MAQLRGLTEILGSTRRTWLVTGAAGFIGSHLVEGLLLADQQVVGLDDFSTGYQHNLDLVLNAVGTQRAKNFRFIDGDIRVPAMCERAVQNVDVVLHQAALGSVPRSVEDPATTNAVNVAGFLNMLVAAQKAGVKRFVYASSSSIYGDNETLPKRESDVGAPLSPYAASKFANELYAQVFWNVHRFEVVGLRYFNVFGPRQDPKGAYAAVIPRWCEGLVTGQRCEIHGDGSTSRDFCFVENVVSANILAATTKNAAAFGKAFNVACGASTSLAELYRVLSKSIGERLQRAQMVEPNYTPFRAGDIKHSLADISAAEKNLGFKPLMTVSEGLEVVARWYCEHLTAAKI